MGVEALNAVERIKLRLAELSCQARARKTQPHAAPKPARHPPPALHQLLACLTAGRGAGAGLIRRVADLHVSNSGPAASQAQQASPAQPTALARPVLSTSRTLAQTGAVRSRKLPMAPPRELPYLAGIAGVLTSYPNLGSFPPARALAHVSPAPVLDLQTHHHLRCWLAYHW